MCAPTSLPFSRMQTESSRPAAFASCLRRMAAQRPAGPPPTITTSYCMDSRSLIVLSSRRGNTLRLVCPANSLTAASMAREEEPWAGKWNPSALPRRAAHWRGGWKPGVDIAVQEQPRDWLKPAPRHRSDPASRQPQPNVAEPSQETLAALNHGWRAARNCRSRPYRASGSCRTGPKMRRSCCSATDRARGCGCGTADRRRIVGSSPQRMLAAIGIAADSLQRLSLMLPCARHANDRQGPRSLRGNCPQAYPLWRSPSACCCSGDGPALALLGKPLPQARGHVHKVEGVRTVATFHPRHLINRPLDKPLAWKDFLLLMEDEA